MLYDIEAYHNYKMNSAVFNALWHNHLLFTDSVWLFKGMKYFNVV